MGSLVVAPAASRGMTLVDAAATERVGGGRGGTGDDGLGHQRIRDLAVEASQVVLRRPVGGSALSGTN